MKNISKKLLCSLIICCFLISLLCSLPVGALADEELLDGYIKDYNDYRLDAVRRSKPEHFVHYEQFSFMGRYLKYKAWDLPDTDEKSYEYTLVDANGFQFCFAISKTLNGDFPEGDYVSENGVQYKQGSVADIEDLTNMRLLKPAERSWYTFIKVIGITYVYDSDGKLIDIRWKDQDKTYRLYSSEKGAADIWEYPDKGIYTTLRAFLDCDNASTTAREVSEHCKTPYSPKLVNISFARSDWEMTAEGIDPRGFVFEIEMWQSDKYYAYDESGNVTVEYTEPLEGNFEIYGDMLSYRNAYISISIHSKEKRWPSVYVEWIEYPDEPRKTTALSLLLNYDTEKVVLTTLDRLAANVRDEEDARELMSLLVTYFSTPYEEAAAPVEEPTPKWPIFAAVGGGIAVVAAVPVVALLIVRRKRRKISAA